MMRSDTSGPEKSEGSMRWNGPDTFSFRATPSRATLASTPSEGDYWMRDATPWN
jgi:hypothetical protein